MISFLDQEKRCLAFPMSMSRVHLPSAITSKLQYVSDIFNNMVKSSNISHTSNSNSPLVRIPSRLGQSVYTTATVTEK